MAEGLSRKLLENELNLLQEEEEYLDNELRDYFVALSTRKSSSRSISFNSNDLTNKIKKIQDFSPCFEAMIQDSKKLALQIEDCGNLSEKLSSIVRELDLKQMRAQQTLACTEDIINLKDCKNQMLLALEYGNLEIAVKCIRQIHEIDEIATKTSDDYPALQQAEREIRNLAKGNLQKAIESNDIKSVMSLCPLLQTLGLEIEARDNFLEFVEKTIFIAVTADPIGDAMSIQATTFAQILSNVFNSTYSIFQQYLPVVIQGMEGSYGDILFIRKLHARCEQEVTSVLKKYVQIRHLDEVNSQLSLPRPAIPTPEIHSIQDEIGLLIQYCCMYNKYLKSLVAGAESRIRTPSSSPPSPSPTVEKVFSRPCPLELLVDDIINKYYLEGEKWLMRQAVSAALPRAYEDLRSARLDECFFLLQRVALRAVACNHIHAACAVLQFITDSLSDDLLSQARRLLTSSVDRVGAVLRTRLSLQLPSSGDVLSVSQSLKSAISIASSITTAVSAKDPSAQAPTPDSEDNEEDLWGTELPLRSFTLLETCVRYIDRILKDISAAADSVFGQADPSSPGPSDLDRFRLCRENFEGARLSFRQMTLSGLERLSSLVDSLFQDLLPVVFGRSPSSTFRFDLPDEVFPTHPVCLLLPRNFIVPLETILGVCSSTLSEALRDSFSGLVAASLCSRLEQFILQQRFCLSGALKLEECTRAAQSLLSRASSVPLRPKFARLREITSILTSDSLEISLDSLACLTVKEAVTFTNLRIK